MTLAMGIVTDAVVLLEAPVVLRAATSTEAVPPRGKAGIENVVSVVFSEAVTQPLPLILYFTIYDEAVGTPGQLKTASRPDAEPVTLGALGGARLTSCELSLVDRADDEVLMVRPAGVLSAPKVTLIDDAVGADAAPTGVESSGLMKYFTSKFLMFLRTKESFA